MRRRGACPAREAAEDSCYRYRADLPLSPQLEAFVKKALSIEGLVVRELDMGRYRTELETIMDIFNDAWSGNWGFIPFSAAEVGHMAEMLKPLVRPNHFAIAELDGEPAAMAVYLPNLNEAIADLDGRLLPFGWAKLLWRVRISPPKTGRMPLMGIRKKYQGGPMGAALAVAVMGSGSNC